MIRRPPRSTQSRSSAASDVYKRQGVFRGPHFGLPGARPRTGPYPRRAHRGTQKTTGRGALTGEGAMLSPSNVSEKAAEAARFIQDVDGARGAYRRLPRGRVGGPLLHLEHALTAFEHPALSPVGARQGPAGRRGTYRVPGQVRTERLYGTLVSLALRQVGPDRKDARLKGKENALNGLRHQGPLPRI